jgi:hypothetical protein
MLRAVAGAVAENVLSARIIFSIGAADSLRVHYQSSDGTSRTTAFRSAHEGVDTVVLLGLRPDQAYQYEVEAVIDGIVRRSSTGSFRTSPLPRSSRARG